MKEKEIKLQEMERERAFDPQVINANTSKMNEEQRELYRMMLEKVMSNYK